MHINQLNEKNCSRIYIDKCITAINDERGKYKIIAKARML